MLKIEEVLMSQYGPLLSLAHLAKILDRSADGLRQGLYVESDWSARINAAKLKVGKRVYFRTSDIARFLGGE
ncbi:DNA-binding protein [Pandoraea anhela]|uniref:Plasmid-related protein n=1 Tax=Pandoraea anhela TaxID=2508295 RepID=A0A5E4Z148_9BURK|nr:DNA-binding protein [Pandoraea anhela]VVE54407.1 plasmid-related protein [Pandoraea anhela]